jgi:hypothetical protein
MDSLFSLIIFFLGHSCLFRPNTFCFSYLLLLLIIKHFFKSIIFQKFGTNYFKLDLNFFIKIFLKLFYCQLEIH